MPVCAVWCLSGLDIISDTCFSICVGGGGGRLGLTDDDVTTGPHLGADDECAAALRPFLLSQLPHGCF